MNNESSALISVVIPTRNRCMRLKAAIESAKAQTWQNVEIIVIDDASSDTTLEYLSALAMQDPTVRFVHNDQPEGGAGARNQGIELARGFYVAFLDDDDVWMPEKLQRQLTLLAATPTASAVSCGFLIQQGTQKISTKHLMAPRNEQQILRSNHLGGASMCLTTKKALEAVNGFDAGLRSGQDWDLWIKLYGLGDILLCDQPLVQYISHNDVRITTNVYSAYAGKRRIYLRYKRRMSDETRRSLQCELLFCRKVLLAPCRGRMLTGMRAVLALANFSESAHFVWRFMKYFRTFCVVRG